MPLRAVGTGPRETMTINPLEAAVVAGELVARQIWFRLPEDRREALRARLLPAADPEARPAVSLARLRQQLRSVVPAGTRMLMVHSSMDGFRLLDEADAMLTGPKAALELLKLLKELAGPDATLCMPTHPLYKGDPGYLYDKSDLLLRYSPRRTPSSVGLLTEFFRREPDALRSAHPLSSLAALGPEAAALLRDNLNDCEPLPHGVDSGYYRFCRAGGLVLGIGVDLLKYLTILHVPEEVADAAWPVRGFFARRRFLVEQENGDDREVVVRERRPEFVRGLSHRRLRREFTAEGFLRETLVDGVRVDTVASGPFLEFVTMRQRKGPYPYYFPALARVGSPPRAVPS